MFCDTSPVVKHHQTFCNGELQHLFLPPVLQLSTRTVLSQGDLRQSSAAPPPHEPLPLSIGPGQATSTLHRAGISGRRNMEGEEGQRRVWLKEGYGGGGERKGMDEGRVWRGRRERKGMNEGKGMEGEERKEGYGRRKGYGGGGEKGRV